MTKNFIKIVVFTLIITSLISCGEKIISLISCGENKTTSPTATAGVSTSALQRIIESGSLVGVSDSTDMLVRFILNGITDPINQDTAKLNAIYATENGAGTYSGNNWANSIAATNLRNKLTNLNASPTNVYAVLVAGGTYKPNYDGDRNISFAMKNHVAIIGGFDATGSWEITGTTTFSGDIGTTNSANDNTHRVFSHDGLPLDNGVLYGVTVTGGNENSSSAGRGGGMYNDNSSPRLVNVVFSGNGAEYGGGGMYNKASSPRLINVVFTGNITYQGGGMYNNNSTPVLTGVSFSNNSATASGAGMFNNESSPMLTSVVFSGNSATNRGGGMYNDYSSPVLIGVVFNGNSATQRGGGMYNNNDAKPGPLIVNAIFAGNTAPTGQDIGMNFHSDENIRIAGSVLGITLANPTNGIVGVGRRAIRIAYHSLTNTAVNFGANQGDSSAKDLGLYVRRSGTDYYFSENTTAWYTNFTATGGFGPAVTLPTTDVEDLTATDITGRARVGRPDAGVYEYKP